MSSEAVTVSEFCGGANPENSCSCLAGPLVELGRLQIERYPSSVREHVLKPLAVPNSHTVRPGSATEKSYTIVFSGTPGQGRRRHCQAGATLPRVPVHNKNSIELNSNKAAGRPFGPVTRTRNAAHDASGRDASFALRSDHDMPRQLRPLVPWSGSARQQSMAPVVAIAKMVAAWT
jgi:hypothetical protein